MMRRVQIAAVAPPSSIDSLHVRSAATATSALSRDRPLDPALSQDAVAQARCAVHMTATRVVSDRFDRAWNGMSVHGLWLLAIACAASVVVAETPDEAKRAAFRAHSEKLVRIQTRVVGTRPRRREQPSRPTNIGDDEVREIQRLTADLWPDSIVNISTVVVGCPCEDGPSCTDQVWVAGQRRAVIKGLLLSRIEGRWAVGPVQQWWMEYERLQSRRAEFPSYMAYGRARDALLEAFPICTVSTATAGNKSPTVRP